MSLVCSLHAHQSFCFKKITGTNWFFNFFIFKLFLFPGLRRTRSLSRVFTLCTVQHLAGCRDLNTSCCDRSQVCYQWATHTPFLIFTYPYFTLKKLWHPSISNFRNQSNLVCILIHLCELVVCKKGNGIHKHSNCMYCFLYHF